MRDLHNSFLIHLHPQFSEQRLDYGRSPTAICQINQQPHFFEFLFSVKTVPIILQTAHLLLKQPYEVYIITLPIHT